MAQKDRIVPELAVEDRDVRDKLLRSPTNTTREVTDNPTGELANSIALGAGAIEQMEAEGQREFIDSDVLPVRMVGKLRETLEKAGVKFLAPVGGDTLWQYVELPEGWSKRATESALWTHLHNAKGEKVARIFYKAAYYDREAYAQG